MKRPARRETIVEHWDGSTEHHDHDTGERWVIHAPVLTDLTPGDRLVTWLWLRPMTADDVTGTNGTIH